MKKIWIDKKNKICFVKPTYLICDTIVNNKELLPKRHDSLDSFNVFVLVADNKLIRLLQYSNINNR
jgi:hypothetical protein